MKKRPKENLINNFSAKNTFEEEEFKNIIGGKEIQSLMDDFYSLTNIGMAIMDLKGSILISTGWQDICVKFHRVNIDSQKNCIESDLYLTRNIKPGKYSLYKCKNNMWDAVTPIIIGNKHMGNLYFGQFFFNDENIDLKTFEDQADKFGFDKKTYIAAIDKVPRRSRVEIETAMNFYSKFAQMISSLSLSNLSLAKTLSDFEQAERELQVKDFAIKSSISAIVLADMDGKINYVNNAFMKLWGYSKQNEVIGKDISEFTVSKEQVKELILSIEAEKGYFGEGYCTRKDGTNFFSQMAANLILSSDSKPLSMMASFIDITDRKQNEKILHESEEKYRTLVEKVNESILIIQDGNFVFANHRANELMGISEGGLIGKPFLDYVWPEDRGMVGSNYLKRIAGEIEDSAYDFRIMDLEGKPIWVFMSAVLIQYKGRPATLVMVTDITERKKIGERLKQQTEAMEATVDGIAILNKDEDYIYLNKSHARIYGYDSPLEMIGKPWSILYDLDELQRFKNDIMPKLKENGHWQGEAIGLKKDGSKFFQEISLTALIEGELICIVRDITQRKNRENEILHLSYHDKLTGLYNRRFVEEEIIRLDTKRQLPLSIIMGDLNSLKLTNDTFGHNMGDMILEEAAKLLKNICRSDDILARWGGDEFVIILPKTSVTSSEKIVQRIKNECTKLIIQKIPLSLSIGTATKSEEKQDINKVIIEAENNMYKNKLAQKESNASSIISALEQALSEKSSETMEHAIRIKDNAIKLGKSIKLHSHQLDELFLLSSLHDIGKVAIPENILSKAGKLTEKEWTIIKRHPEIGFNIAQSSPQIVHVAKFILACHENWDGSGYPKGLKGEAIPIVSRIIFICDAYDVMTSKRIYRGAISKEEAITELKRCAGTQFDPVLVEKFIEIISN
jgi:diguanylate cyclase (GGDEF)-like protein/PAS domain S-box-containing protein